jgi:sugar phosphate isomerase/epimerase
MKWTIGGSTWGFYGGDDSSAWVPLDQAVEAVAAAGLGVEIWPTRGAGDPGPLPDQTSRMRDVLDEAPFATVHVRPQYWHWNSGWLKREIDLTAELGGRLLVLHPVCLGLGRCEDRLEVDAVRRLAGYAAERGVRLTLENLQDTAWALDRVLEEIGDEPEETNLGICIDLGHAFLSGDAGRDPIRGYLERYREQLIHLHVHDNAGDGDAHCPPPDGNIDWNVVAACLRTVAFEGTSALEVRRDGENPARTIIESARFLRTLF